MLLEKTQHYHGEIPLLPVKQHLRCLLLLPCPRPSPAPSLLLAMAIPWLRELTQLQTDFWGFPTGSAAWADLQSTREAGEDAELRGTGSVPSLSSGSRADTPPGVPVRKPQHFPVTAQGWSRSCTRGSKATAAQLSPSPEASPGFWGLREQGSLPWVLTCLCFLLPLVELLSEGCFWDSRACFSGALFFSALAASASL